MRVGTVFAGDFSRENNPPGKETIRDMQYKELLIFRSYTPVECECGTALKH
jgi:hypothetical protein